MTVDKEGQFQPTVIKGGTKAGRDGTVTVDGANATVTLSGVDGTGQGAFLNVGRDGTGTFSVLNGASISIDGGIGTFTGFQAGREAGGDGTIVVDGTGSSITVSSSLTDFTAGFIAIGRSGTGDLQITNGGTVTNEATGVMFIGREIGGVGTVLVGDTSGNVSTLDAGAQLVIAETYDFSTGTPLGAGTGGTGTLTIGAFGTVIADEVFVGTDGTIGGVGTLQAAAITFDGGTVDPGLSVGTLVLDGNLTVNDATFLIEMRNPGTIEADLISVTGTAEIIIHGLDGTNAWFCGYLPYGKPRLAFCAVFYAAEREGYGQGGKIAAKAVAYFLDGMARDPKLRRYLLPRESGR